MKQHFPTTELVEFLSPSTRPWWSIDRNKSVTAGTVYSPYGCRDWGQTNGKRNEKCTFCALPNAVITLEKEFNNGEPFSDEQLAVLFDRVSQKLERNSVLDEVWIFNAGSFLAMPWELQEHMVRAIAALPHVQRLVIESRAVLVTDKTVQPIIDILHPAGKQLTIRLGIETKDRPLRAILKKSDSIHHIENAANVMRKLGVTSGAYALLKSINHYKTDLQAVDEACDTIAWLLGELEMDEVYCCSTNVGPDTPLERLWRAGKFQPASLWMVLNVLQRVWPDYGDHIHFLPFTDTPEFLAVPSNHVPQGIDEALAQAQGCDRAFHEMFEQFRTTRDLTVLQPPECNCQPT